MRPYSERYPTEAEFLEDALDYTNAFPGMTGVRIDGEITSGKSDIFICADGKFIVAELKKYNGVASPQQLKFIRRIQKAGGWGAVCYTMQEVIDLINMSRRQYV